MMAKAIDDYPRPNPREILMRKLERAPEAHAEALLDAYEILQLLRDKGLLEIAKGALGSGDKLLTLATETAQEEGSIAFIRNLTCLVKIVGAMNPVVLEDVEKTLLNSVNRARDQKPPSLFKIFRKFSGENSRRFLAATASLVDSFGKTMSIADQPGRKRKRVYRHNA